jgi:hypothetical protein
VRNKKGFDQMPNISFTGEKECDSYLDVLNGCIINKSSVVVYEDVDGKKHNLIGVLRFYDIVRFISPTLPHFVKGHRLRHLGDSTRFAVETSPDGYIVTLRNLQPEDILINGVSEREQLRLLEEAGKACRGYKAPLVVDFAL